MALLMETPMPNVHRNAPIGWRPPPDLRAWLMTYTEATGRPISAIITEAMLAFRASHSQPPPASGDTTSDVSP